MNCTQFEDWLRETIGDRNRTLPAVATAHLDCCPNCQMRWTGEQRLERAIAVWAAAPLPMLSFETCLSQLLDEGGAAAHTSLKSQGRPATRWRSWAPIAAAVLVLAATAIALRTPPKTSDAIVSTESPAHTSEPPPTQVSESVALLWFDLQSSSRAVAQETVLSLTQFPPVPSPVTLTDEPPAVAAPLWRLWSEPIGETVNSGFGFLNEVLPRPPAS